MGPEKFKRTVVLEKGLLPKLSERGDSSALFAGGDKIHCSKWKSRKTIGLIVPEKHDEYEGKNCLKRNEKLLKLHSVVIEALLKPTR